MESTRRIRPHVVVVAAVGTLVAFGYLAYALTAWFHQDDFLFIDRFSGHLHPSDLVSLEGFGRFLTQNVYWHIGTRVLGRNAQLFFFVNAMIIAATTILVQRIARLVVSPAAAATAALMYAASPRVVHAFAWISNSQHLIAHLLCVSFVLVLVSREGSLVDGRRAGGLFVLFALGLISNSFTLALLAPLLWHGLDRTTRASMAYRRLIAACVLLGVAFVVRTRDAAVGAYEVSVSLDIVRTNARYYFGSVTVWALWGLICVVTALVLLRRRRLIESTMFVCSLAFYVPFSCLSYQRFPQYGVLSLVFFLIGSFMVGSRLITTGRFGARRGFIEHMVLVVVTVAVASAGVHELGARLSDPLGVQARHLVETLRNDVRSDDASIHTYCFEHDPVVDGSGQVTNEDPAVWWWVGHGLAFSLFVDPSKQYVLGARSPECQQTYFISPDSLVKIGDHVDQVP